MSNIDVTQLISQLHAMSAEAQGMPQKAAPATGGAEFSSLLKGAMEQVNDGQLHARALERAFETKSGQVSLSQVMIAVEKASISFQAMTQVRNKLVSAYQDIMSMQL
ncbi:MAG: flagellar hook-basal body complex protein FliE [Acidiferrobacterales bacterium]